MVLVLLLGSCASPGESIEENEALKAEVEVFVSQLFKAADARDLDYLSNMWWEGAAGEDSGQPAPAGRKGSSRANAEEWTSEDQAAYWTAYQGLDLICVKTYEGEVWAPLVNQGVIEHHPVPGLAAGDTATFEVKLMFTPGTQGALLTYRGFHLIKVGGEWKIHSSSDSLKSSGCP